MNVLKHFHRLYTDDFYIADCLGGRGGARSYAITQRALYLLLYEKKFTAFFLRQTHSSIYSSMWKDFKDRVKEYEELHNCDLSSIITVSDNKQGENYAVNKLTGGTITTKGFQTSSGQNSANLKSLAGATHLFIDEADEVDYTPFLKVKMSLRKKGVKIQIYRAFNPPQKDHWIWDDYVMQPMTSDDIFNEIKSITNDKDLSRIRQIIEDSDYEFYKPLKPTASNHIAIITKYSDTYDLFNDEAINDFEKLKYTNYFRYCTEVLGLIPRTLTGVIYPNYKIGEFPEEQFTLHGFGLDFGSNDPDALTEVKIDRPSRKIYIKLHYCKNNTSVKGLMEVLKSRVGYTKRIVADSAERRLIRDFYNKGLNIHRANKKVPVATQIKFLQDWEIIIFDENRRFIVTYDDKELDYSLVNCFNNYVWHDKKAGVIKHDYSDPMDSWRYIVVDLLNIR